MNRNTPATRSDSLRSSDTCAFCAIDVHGTYWPTCADLQYKHPDARNWAPLHSVVCARLGMTDDADRLCDDCAARLSADVQRGTQVTTTEDQ